MPVTTRQIGLCFAAEVEGVDMTQPLSPEEVAAIHAGMDTYAVLVAIQREFVYAHKWRVGDLVMWDNRQTMHRARPFPAHEPRDMRRTTLRGDGPTVAQAAA